MDDLNENITNRATSGDTSLVTVSVINDALTLNYQANAYGNAIIVVTGTSNGKAVDNYFSVSVTQSMMHQLFLAWMETQVLALSF